MKVLPKHSPSVGMIKPVLILFLALCGPAAVGQTIVLREIVRLPDSVDNEDGQYRASGSHFLVSNFGFGFTYGGTSGNIEVDPTSRVSLHYGLQYQLRHFSRLSSLYGLRIATTGYRFNEEKSEKVFPDSVDYRKQTLNHVTLEPTLGLRIHLKKPDEQKLGAYLDLGASALLTLGNRLVTRFEDPRNGNDIVTRRDMRFYQSTWLNYAFWGRLGWNAVSVHVLYRPEDLFDQDELPVQLPKYTVSLDFLIGADGD
jgi:hypothetical protein